MSGNKAKKIINSVKNPLEAVIERGDPTGVVKGVGKSLVDDLALAGGADFLSFLGLDTSTSADNHNQEEKNPKSHDIVNFKKSEEKPRKEQHIEAAIDYHRDIIRYREQGSKRETHQRNSQVEEILIELKQLVATTKSVQAEFLQISVEEKPVSAGIYHANFFEWMLTVIRSAREKVEDSGAWLNAMKGKGSKKSAGYWGMFKKHGTSFAMSNERGVATQTG